MTDNTPRPVALVTGASRGLGFALALELSATHHVVAIARTTGGLEELDDAITARGGSATLAPIDMTDADAVAHICRAIHDRWGGAALWVHTAIHAAPLGPTAHLDATDWDKSIATNAGATRLLITMVAPLLGATGRAVFFDDPQAGKPFFGHYGASKAAQMALVGSWAAETHRTGPGVTVLQPHPMATATQARFHPGKDRATLASPGDEARRLLPAILG